MRTTLKAVAGQQHRAAPSRVEVELDDLIGLHRDARLLRLPAGRIRSMDSGGYVSPFKGRGMEFDEARPYMPGDDVRNLDWRVIARTGKPYTKLFREERERSVLLWMDFSPSMFFATRGCFKSVQVARLAALLAWAGVQNGDRVGGLLFSGAEHHEYKPLNGRNAALGLCRRIQHFAATAAQKRDSEARAAVDALLRLRRVARPGSLIFLLSDFHAIDEAMEQQLAQLRRHNELVLLEVSDPLERALPDAGQYRLSDGQGELLVDTADRKYRQGYEQRYARHHDYLQGRCRSLGMGYLHCSTEDEPLQVLQAQSGAWL